MKFKKLRPVVTRGAVRVVYKKGEETVKESFRSMDAVPDTYDDKKILYVAARDDIMIETKSSDEPVAVRGIQVCIEIPEKKEKKGKKDKKHEKKKSKEKALKHELGIDSSIIDPDIANDPVDKALRDDEKDED